MKEVIAKVQKSDAFLSFQIEKKIQETIESHNWRTIRSAYFVDSNSGKSREVDIVADYCFEKNINEDDELMSSLVLLVECKSLTNYHILADSRVSNFSESNHNVWLGADSYERHFRLNNILDKTSLTTQKKTKVMGILDDWAFPEGISLFADYSPGPFNDIICFSSFRETNLSVIKELDNSVVWKSFLSLNAAAAGYETDFWEMAESDLLTSIDHIESNDTNIKSTLKNLFYHFHGTKHASLHKVLVIDSSIWEATDNITTLPYFRLIQKSIHGHTRAWIDVVSLASFPDYIEKVSEYYRNEFLNAGMNKRK